MPAATECFTHPWCDECAPCGFRTYLEILVLLIADCDVSFLG